MKNIFIAATGKNVGKSTISFALLDLLIKENKEVAFMKPVGQRWLHSKWGKVEEDVILMKQIFQFSASPPFMNPIVVEKGFTEEYLYKIIKPNIHRKILNAYEKISKNKEFVIIEGTGHAGVGSVFNTSNAEVAKILDADVVLVVDGGIGSAIDKLELNRSFFINHGVNVVGVIVNKVISNKSERIKNAISTYCKQHKIKFLGIVPYSTILSNPTLGQIINELHPKIIHETNERKTVVDTFAIGATSLEEFIEYVKTMKGNILLILPSLRLDMIFTIPNLKNFFENKETRIHTILFTGKHEPSQIATQTLINEKINILWEKGDTYHVASRLSSIAIKTRPEDIYKIEEIKNIVIRNIYYKKLFQSVSQSNIIIPLITKIINKLLFLWEKIRSFFTNF
ncbi:MAG: AAA family ATPase [bacterium]